MVHGESDHDDFFSLVGNEYFLTLVAASRTAVINSLDERVKKALDNYCKKAAKIPVPPTNKGMTANYKNVSAKSVDVVFTFGPLLYWTKTDWKEIECKFNASSRKAKLDEGVRKVQQQHDHEKLE